MRVLFFLLILISFHTFADDRKPVINGKLFVPEGFDTNDLVEVVVVGELLDLCHRNPTFELERKGNVFNIYLYSYFYPDTTCKEIVLPYMQKVTLGVLRKGTYQVNLKDYRTTTSSAQIIVDAANSNLQDNFNYGNVMGIREFSKTRKIELIGTNPVDCLIFEKLEAVIEGEVIVLMPHFKQSGECNQIPTPFSFFYDVPTLIGPKDILLHVRVMDGRSYNYLYKNKLAH